VFLAGVPVGAVGELDHTDIPRAENVRRVEFTARGAGTHPNYRPGVDSTRTGDSRLTAVPPKPSNGMSTTSLRVATWTKSRYSNPHGDCLELAELASGEIAVRNSRRPGGLALVFARAEMAAFIQNVNEGRFDEMIIERPVSP
jgi:hypothetical protein